MTAVDPEPGKGPLAVVRHPGADGPLAAGGCGAGLAAGRGEGPLAAGRAVSLALLGDDGARLLAGPPESSGPEPLLSHERRLGTLHLPADRRALAALVAAAGVIGRGGGEFPLARKLSTAAEAAACGGPTAEPLVVVNGSEGEPASRKDRTLLERRPHLVLDGAQVAAATVGAPGVVVVVHAGRAATIEVVEQAVMERRAAGIDAALVQLAEAPAAYVAGESSAVVAMLQGAAPRPGRRRLPVAASGVAGRPTVVANAESLAHLALVARFGHRWFRQAGSDGAPGSTLVTLAGGVAIPGLVVEVLGPETFGTLLRHHGGWERPPQAVLLGGYGGCWVDGEALWDAPVDRAALRSAGAGLGCGLVAPLPPGACGLAVTARLLRYLARESAGQCGPCVLGLPALADLLDAVVAAGAGRGAIRRMRHQALSVRGGGDCGHPDGAVDLLETALSVFEGDVAAHLGHGGCGKGTGGWFPLSSGSGRP